MRILLALIFCASAWGQMIIPIVTVGPAAAAYSGPGDTVGSAKAWWGLQAYSAATAGTKSCNVCNSGDANCADVNTLANGNFDVATATGAPLNCGGIGGTCTTKTLYDKIATGTCKLAGVDHTCDLTQPTIAKRPTLVLNCLGSLPCFGFNGSQSMDMASVGLGADIAQPYTVSVVANRTGGIGSQGELVDVNSDTVVIGYWSTGQFRLYAGNNATFTITDSAFHAIQNVGNGASSVGYVDGVSTTIDSGTNAMGLGGNIFLGGNVSNPTFTGKIAEMGIWAIGFTPTQQSNMDTNQHGRLGF